MAIDDTKDKIVNVATKSFSRFGFHLTSMDEIAKIGGNVMGSLYYHFSGKEELFKELVTYEMVRKISKQQAVMEFIKEDNQIIWAISNNYQLVHKSLRNLILKKAG